MHTMFSKLDTDQAQHGLWFNTACTQVRQGNWHAAALSLSRLSAALRRHLRAEEAGLLTALADRLGQDNTSTAMLRVEHQQVLGVLARMDASLAEADRSAFMKHA
ncbi:hemerythrin domain-containing protein [Massilia sp. H-1]|nr:hemerythrin domain-containing protein [Massilia sp. H-1]